MPRSGARRRGEAYAPRMSDEDVQTGGWDAITAACDAIYPDQEPRHYGTLIKYMLGGPDPIDGISVYTNDDPVPHWHYVTYGFSELYEKESDDPEESGYGFELTLRLARKPGEEEPPVFVANFLQNLARYVFDSGNVFEAGEHIDFNGPIAAGTDTAITAGCFAADPELGEIDTPNGHLRFVQVVGITADELDAIKTWNTNGVLGLLARVHPKWVIDTARRSILEDAALADEVRAKAASEGSSTGALYSSSLEIEPAGDGAHIRIGALEMRSIAAVLPGRLPHGRDLSISGRSSMLVFHPGEASGLAVEDEDVYVMSLSDAACAEVVGTLRPERGEYRFAELPDLVIEVVPTEIRAQNGDVVEVIG